MAKKTPSGKYRGRVQIGVDKDGKPISKYVSAKTRRELEQKKEYIRHHYVDGHPIREDLPFYQYAEEWYTLKKNRLFLMPVEAHTARCSISIFFRRLAFAICALFLLARYRLSSIPLPIPANRRLRWRWVRSKPYLPAHIPTASSSATQAYRSSARRQRKRPSAAR